MQTTCRPLVLALCLMAAPFAKADTIVINFSGTIEESTGPAPTLEHITNGEQYSGQAVYTLPGTPTAPGDYTFSGPSEGITLSIGGYTVSSVGLGTKNASVTQVQFPFPMYGLYDSFTFGGGSPTGNLPGVTPIVYGSLELGLVGTPGFIACCEMPTSINAADLVQTNPGEFSADTIMFLSFGEEGAGADVLGNVESVTLTDISTPEPASIALVALVSLGFGLSIVAKRLRWH